MKLPEQFTRALLKGELPGTGTCPAHVYMRAGLQYNLGIYEAFAMNIANTRQRRME